MYKIPNLERRVRSNDPDTSWDAAQSITPGELSSLQRWILEQLFIGQATDQELTELHAEAATFDHVRTVTPQRIRTARKELERQGLLAATGATRLTNTGRKTRVWGIK